MSARASFALFVTVLLSLFGVTHAAADPPRTSPGTRGIYLQASTVQDAERLKHLIGNSLEVGINTFVVDLWTPSKSYERGIESIRRAGIVYVPRIVVFADGGTHAQVTSPALWEKRWRLAKYALSLGAKDIQLDYIRYNSRTKASPENARYVRRVVEFFEQRAKDAGARLQIDVFGDAAHAPSLHVGQDIGLLAPHVDVVCPMVYPSHYEPYRERAQLPYETVFDSLLAVKRQIGNHPVDVLAYIELSNFRYRMGTAERIDYIRAQLRAVEQAQAQGFFAWSAGNKYDLLFEVLRREQADADS